MDSSARATGKGYLVLWFQPQSILGQNTDSGSFPLQLSFCSATVSYKESQGFKFPFKMYITFNFTINDFSMSVKNIVYMIERTRVIKKILDEVSWPKYYR